MDNSNLCCLVLTYNEEKRLRVFFQHVDKWAAKVVIVDKSSTDATRDIAHAAGAAVVTIPFSKQGHERPSTYHDEVVSALGGDRWIIGLTPGEIPTRKLIDSIKHAVASPTVQHVDVGLIPIKIYSFGTHDPNGPWGTSVMLQPRLYYSGRVQYEDKMHQALKLTSASVMFNFTADQYVFHPTHRSFESFLNAHIDYAVGEVTDSENFLYQAVQQSDFAKKFDEYENALPIDKRRQVYAWKMYRYMVALKHLDEGLSESTRLEYERLISTHLLDFGS
jgi:hypothetical protein